MRIIQFYLPLWIAFTYNLYCYFKVVKQIRNYVSGTLELRFISRLKYYPLVLVFCWTFATINRLYTFFADENITLTILHITFGGLQGFINALVYGCTTSVRQECGQRFKCLRSCLYSNVENQEVVDLRKDPEQIDAKNELENIELNIISRN